MKLFIQFDKPLDYFLTDDKMAESLSIHLIEKPLSKILLNPLGYHIQKSGRSHLMVKRSISL